MTLPFISTQWLERSAIAIWAVFLAFALWFLHLLGSGPLATPPVFQPGNLGQWIQDVGAANGVIAVIRMVGVLIAWYLVVVTIAGSVARQSHSERMVDGANRVTPKFLRRLFASAGGLTLSAAGLAVAVSPMLAPAAGPIEVAAAQAQEDPDLPQVPVVRASDVSDSVVVSEGTARLEQLPADSNGSGTATLTEFDFEFHINAERDGDVWMVEQGDHLWSIAAETIAEAWGRQPTDNQVAPYWVDVIELNRAKLVDPDNPDLLYPGQSIDLPAIPSAPARSS